jgi:hypothetical protein
LILSFDGGMTIFIGFKPVIIYVLGYVLEKDSEFFLNNSANSHRKQFHGQPTNNGKSGT